MNQNTYSGCLCRINTCILPHPPGFGTSCLFFFVGRQREEVMVYSCHLDARSKLCRTHQTYSTPGESPQERMHDAALGLARLVDC